MPSASAPEEGTAVGLEKTVLAILSALIIAVLVWIASTVQQSQLQYARIEERLNAQSTTLTQIQKSLDASGKRFDVLDTRLRQQEQRITILEQKVSQP